MSAMNRRAFLTGLTAAAAVPAAAAPAASAKGRFLFGACVSSSADVAALADLGYDFYEQGVSAAFNPRKDDAWWNRRRAELAAQPLPLRSCNGFIPGSFRLTGPKADVEPALAYAETALRRAEDLGVKTVVFGSGAARNVPGDFAGSSRARPDVEKGLRQFTDFCKRLADRVADLKTVCVVIEPLRPNESNIVNFVWQGQHICEDVRSPRIQLLADFYHMMAGREGAGSIRAAGARLKHCHIAAYRTRLFPGSDPIADARHLKPYFDALRDIGYTGGISCECGWGSHEKRRANFKTALQFIKSL
jgi:sugar phosphate isomerase/epimerase